MKNIFYFLAPILFVACSSSDNEEVSPGPGTVDPPAGTVYSVNGLVQKGPFRTDGNIEVIYLDEHLERIGASHSTKVADNTGRYSTDNQIESRYVEILATGRYFNEVSGEVTTEPTTLRAIADLAETTTVNINVLTTLEFERIRKLVQEENLTLKSARAQAEREILNAFNIPNQMPESISFAQLDISKQTETNAVLLAVSSTLQSDRQPDGVSQILTSISQEIKDHGTIANELLKNEITNGGTRVNPLHVRENLKKTYEDSGVTNLNLPPFENYLDINGNGILDQDENWLLIEETTFNVADEGGTIEVSIQHNIEYEIICEESWITRTGDTRSTQIVTDVLKFNIQPNTTYTPRATRITVRDTNTAREEYITVSQKQKDALTVTKAKYEVAQEGETIGIEVKHNIDFTVEIAEDSKSWIQQLTTRGLTTTQLAFNISANPNTTAVREGQIVVRSGELSETISVFQSGGKTLVLNQQEYNISATGETITVEVTSNIKYEVVLPGEAWIKQTNPAYALATDTYTFEVLLNDTHDTRTATITFRELEGTLVQTVSIMQEAKDGLIIDKRTYEVSDKGGQVDVEVTSNVNYNVSVIEGTEWLSQITSRSLTSKTFSFSAQANPSLEPRTARVAFVCTENELLNDTVSFVQSGDMSPLTVHVATIGTLSEKVNEAQQKSLKNLKITGTINTTDFHFLRDQMLSLQELDLSEVSISGNMIPEGALSKWNGEKVILPEGIISIENSAFNGCKKLIEVTIPKSVQTIRYAAFKGCSLLPAIKIPANVLLIEEDAFSSCTALSLVEFASDAKLREIKCDLNNRYGTFNSCTSLKSIALPASLEKLGPATFNYCTALEEVIIPDDTKLTVLEGRGDYGVFKKCAALKTFHVPANIERLDNSLFRDSGLESITFAPGSKLHTVGSYVFANTFIGKVDLPETVTTLGAGVFMNCNNITSFDVSAMNEIGGHLFSGCSNLKSAILPTHLEEIPEYIFNDCPLLESIILPGKTRIIGESAFRNCTKMALPALPTTLEEIKRWAFSGCNTFITITLPAATILVEAYAFDSCEKLTTFTLSGNESFTLGSAFNDCNRLTTLTLKARKLTFGERFLSGTSIATLEIPTEVEHIEGNVYGTFRLSKVSEVKFAPNARLEVIGDYAFSYAENLSSITLPESVTTLGREVFAGCTLLRTLDLPATISVIGPTTFPIDLEVLKIRATTCPSVSVSLGSFSWLSEYNIQVPIGAVDAYKSHQAWSNCKSITALKD